MISILQTSAMSPSRSRKCRHPILRTVEEARRDAGRRSCLLLRIVGMQGELMKCSAEMCHGSTVCRGGTVIPARMIPELNEYSAMPGDHAWAERWCIQPPCWMDRSMAHPPCNGYKHSVWIKNYIFFGRLRRSNTVVQSSNLILPIPNLRVKRNFCPDFSADERVPRKQIS